MTDERELVKKRGSFKGRLTSFINYLDDLKAKSTSEYDFTTELQLRIGKMETVYQQYDEVQLQLECIVDDINVQISERSEFESLYYRSIARAQNLLKNSTRDIESVGSGKSARASVYKPVKLPTIQLPKFSGSYNNWLEFHDTFTSLIHSNDDIDEINKFHYLRTSLEGAAAVVIQSIEFSANNYAVAWKLLCERFNNKRLLIHNHVSAIFNIETITKESSNVLKNLIDQINKNLRALETLEEPVKHWDTLLIYVISSKLDSKTFREWEECKTQIDKANKITFDAFLQFLRTRADLLETLELSRNNSSQVSMKSSTKVRSMVTVQGPNNSSSDVSTKVCPKCKGDHNLNNCAQFLALSNEARIKLLPTYKVCFNCFRPGHFANRCKKLGCKLCKRRHNTLIHVAEFKSIANTRIDNLSPQSSLQCSSTQTSNIALSTNVTSCDIGDYNGMLSTALVKIRDHSGQEHVVRLVLDNGSTSCFITEKLCTQLGLATNEIDKPIFGINKGTSRVGKTCRVSMTALNDSFELQLFCFVLPSITTALPCHNINLSDLNIPSHLCLADPTFYKPAEVDILIGANVFWDLLGTQRIKLGNGKPFLVETSLGWIVTGPLSCNYNVTLLSNDTECHFARSGSTTSSDLDDLRTDLTKFWQLEEVNVKTSHYSPEEKRCEEHFVKNTKRLANGRFCVRIPLKHDPCVLGDSVRKATQCLYSLERRLKSKPEFSRMYHAFMSEYESLGHMTEFKPSKLRPSGYFIPHHGVLREQSTTTKLRVVFNASCPTSSGISSNDLQMVGPTIQDDILSILLRFRQYKYVLSGDVQMMYRCVDVHPSDRYLQQIIWRGQDKGNVKVYKLNTVTYGTASAPFLATRCLYQLGLDCKNEKVANVIKYDFYVDDLLTGGDDLNEVRFIRQEVTKALASACMPLRKWKSNEPQLLTEITQSSLDLNIGSTEPDKLLGLGWYASTDELVFSISSAVHSNNNTKRDLLSVIARIFDPLGLLSPFVITMKMLLQRMWLDKLSWDEPLPPEINSHWQGITENLPSINDFRIPRIVVCESYTHLELHIFTDASERAYGACAYIRSINGEGKCMVRLLMAKSRVAPIKPTTIPRLELCGAVVGARLCEKVSSSLRAKFSRIYCWTDSTIVLGWLQMLPSKLQPFVRNRVAEILEQAGHCIWRHVPTDKNPADLISRGVNISNLQGLDLWWSGPEFLIKDLCDWPSLVKSSELDSLPETRPDISLSVIVDHTNNKRLINFSRFSNYSRLVRSMAYVLRFIKMCRKQLLSSSYLSSDELQKALDILILQSQRESFPEYKLLLTKQNLPKKSVLLKFNVYLDQNYIIRVGGRLDNSEFDYNKRHPIILQSTHEFTKLLFKFEHKRLMHAGPQLLLASIRESYWPIGGRNLAKACYHGCVLCRRMKGKVVTPIMGNLPRQRLLPGGFPFESTGVDYAGPIMCASRQGRGCRLVKVYIAIFICFTTKAIHLELVGNLTSRNYLLSLYRFISRRGKPVHIYSDNGTSFVGAYKELSKFLQTSCDSLSEGIANEGINLHFIPAYTPHFGGLWEAGVKSAKYHLQRVLGNCNLTFEELNTILVQIEAILNSRPLTPLSSDPADFTPLTPGHFLVGRPLTSLPQQNVEDHSINCLSRYHRIEQLRQHFWKRWSKEFVAELQQRVKWRSCKGDLKLDTLVVIKEDNLPPLKWKLGRIVAVHPGSDGIVRVADVKTSTGIIRRAFNRICPLPVISESG